MRGRDDDGARGNESESEREWETESDDDGDGARETESEREWEWELCVFWTEFTWVFLSACDDGHVDRKETESNELGFLAYKSSPMNLVSRLTNQVQWTWFLAYVYTLATSATGKTRNPSTIYLIL